MSEDPDHVSHMLSDRPDWMPRSHRDPSHYDQYLKEYAEQQANKPSIWVATEAFLTNEGIFLEVNPTLRIRLTTASCRKLMTLITAAELSKLLPPDDSVR